jgi:ribosomal protein S18 acetylase RimI-like enzyme
VLRFGTLAGDARADVLLRSVGYAAVRTFWHMRVDFDGPPPPASWPAGATVTAFDPPDAAAVHAALAEAFDDHFGESFPGLESWLHQYVGGDPASFDPTLWRVVRIDGEIAAAATCLLEWPEVPTHGYVAELGVRRAFRRRGLGEALLRDVFCDLHGRGRAGATLHVDSESETGANRLYERVGMVGTPRYVSYQRLGGGGR